ncbi:MAG TPA: hypothetical protein VLV78_07345 [Thermoanaerobaculia bacterium]|nr:hypothetical protein [Thermoanaerobaculia bacterium]
MRRSLLFLAATLVALPVFARHGNRDVSFNDSDFASTDCSAMSVRFDGGRVPVVSEDVAVGNVRSLRVRSDRNGGIRVIGSSGSGYAVKACKAVGSGLEASQIRVAFDGNEVSASGPDNEDWIVYFIVQTPRNASLDLESRNGPVGVYQFNGTMTARAKNGPLSLKESSGTIDASTVNGPISLSGGSGNVKLAATNGPLSVKLDGYAWEGGNLDGTTQNGPVSLKLPRGYRSGVVLEALGHGPVSCHAEDCYTARQRVAESDDDDQPRRIELGSGAPAVHLSTVNGPVSVKDQE